MNPEKEQTHRLPDIVVMVQMSAENWEAFERAFTTMATVNAAPPTKRDRDIFLNAAMQMCNALMKMDGSTLKWLDPQDFNIRAHAVRGAIQTHPLTPSEN
jgi:hypothetical protein